MSDPKNGAKSAEKIPALIVFGRFPGSKLNQAAAYDKKDAEAAKILRQGLLFIGEPVHRGQLFHPDSPRHLAPRHLLQFGVGG